MHWCFVREFCVILDVAHNRYISVPAYIMEQLIPYIRKSETDFLAHPTVIPPEALALSEELIAARLLTTAYYPSVTTPHSKLPRPGRLLSQFPSGNMRRERLFLGPSFLRACIFSDYLLRQVSLSRIVERVASRRDRLTHMPAELTDEKITHLASVFVALRPYYPRRYWCMFDSLALLEFLSQWSIVPRWVFGVSTDPFSAHCWVQERDLVLCDTRDFSSASFSPIMTI